MQGVDREGLPAGLRDLVVGSAIGLAPSDLAIARRMSGAFWLIGAVITALLLPWATPTAELGDIGWPVAIVGVLIGLWVGHRHYYSEVSLGRIYFAGFAGVLLIVALEWLAGGRGTPYHYLLLLPVLFATAAQSPRRIRDFALLVSIVIWIPLLYEGTDRQVVLDIATQLVTLFAIGIAVFALFVVLRMQRRTIREQRAQAELLARRDELTGLGNRRAFGEALEREIARARRNGRQLSVVVGDLDNFKEINDQLGHAAGDDSLRLTAEALIGIARESDACFRWGGDEFAILLPETDRAQAEGVAERLRSAIGEVSASPGTPQLEITCGIAELGAEGDADALIGQADRELLTHKGFSASSS